MSDYDTRVATLRATVRKVLNEDDGGGGDWGDAGGDYFGDIGGYGGGFIGTHSLYSIFIEPFVDVAKVGLGGVEQVFSKTRALLETVIHSLIPGMVKNWDGIFAAEKDRSEKIKQKYKAAYTRAMRTDTDQIIFSFMLAPYEFLTLKFVEKSPIVASASLDAISETLVTLLGRGRVAEFLQAKIDELKTIAKLQKRGKKKTAASKLTEFYDEVESFAGFEEASVVGAIGGFAAPLAGPKKKKKLAEDDAPKKRDMTVRGALAALLTSQPVKEAFEASDVVTKMKADAKAVMSPTLMQIKNTVEKGMSAKSLAELDKLFGTNSAAAMGSVPDESKNQVNAAAVKQARLAMKNFYEVRIKMEIKKVKELGLSDSDEYVKVYERLLAKLNSTSK